MIQRWVPCRSGICRTPLEVTSSQLIASELCPVFVVKALLYPGAIANALLRENRIPSYSHLLKLYKLTNMKPTSASSDLRRIEVLAGSYLSVAGAILGLNKPGRMSLFGILLVIWGIVREGGMGKSAKLNQTKGNYMYPAMLVALVSALFSIRKDVRKILRCFQGRRVVKEKHF
ncbi:Tail fiber [Quillaja saponaria]|uniref:Tail fiber n=1 Tax=Quillaja saponaria TaxID=32244 RepID=A0AAD7LRI6_QUISA|nr:Tail fiber [Quillaja saponaria]